MIKETETETEKCDEGGITYRPLDMLRVVLLSLAANSMQVSH